MRWLIFVGALLKRAFSGLGEDIGRIRPVSLLMIGAALFLGSCAAFCTRTALPTEDCRVLAIEQFREVKTKGALGRKKTKVLMVCEAGRKEVEVFDGHWTLEELRGQEDQPVEWKRGPRP